jgi:hypothetical protein
VAKGDIDVRLRLKGGNAFQKETDASSKSVTKFGKTTDRAGHSLRRYARGIVGVGAAYGALNVIKKSVTNTVDLQKASAKLMRTGYSPAAATGIAGLAKAKNIDANAVANATTIYNKHRKAALEGNKAERARFKGLLSMADLHRPLNTQLELLQKRLSGVTDVQNRNAMSSALMGKGANKLAPIFNNTNKALALSKKYGLGFSRSDLANGQKFIDMQMEWQFAMMGAQKLIAEKVMPAVLKLVAGITKLTKWFERQGPIIRGMIEGFVLWVAVIGPIWRKLDKISSSLGLFSGKAGTATTRTGELKTGVGGLSRGLAALQLAGAAAFIGWEIGSALRRIKPLAHAVDDLVGKLSSLTGIWQGPDVLSPSASNRRLRGIRSGRLPGLNDRDRGAHSRGYYLPGGHGDHLTRLHRGAHASKVSPLRGPISADSGPFESHTHIHLNGREIAEEVARYTRNGKARR